MPGVPNIFTPHEFVPTFYHYTCVFLRFFWKGNIGSSRTAQSTIQQMKLSGQLLQPFFALQITRVIVFWFQAYNRPLTGLNFSHFMLRVSVLSFLLSSQIASTFFVGFDHSLHMAFLMHMQTTETSGCCWMVYFMREALCFVTRSKSVPTLIRLIPCHTVII